MNPHHHLLRLLHDQDRLTPPRASLAPDRTHATPLAALGLQLLTPHLTHDAAEAFTLGLLRIARAQAEHFPQNLFQDMDRIAADLLHDDPHTIQDRADAIADLQAIFGARSPIRFRYVHDFTYGFDWARWVAKAPAQRAHLGPFSLPFLRDMRRRADEILLLIEQHDAEYPPLPDGTSRNPFAFTREPHAEHLLFTTLAQRDLLPVRAWSTSAPHTWNRPFRELRADLAHDLGLSS